MEPRLWRTACIVVNTSYRGPVVTAAFSEARCATRRSISTATRRPAVSASSRWPSRPARSSARAASTSRSAPSVPAEPLRSCPSARSRSASRLATAPRIAASRRGLSDDEHLLHFRQQFVVAVHPEKRSLAVNDRRRARLVLGTRGRDPLLDRGKERHRIDRLGQIAVHAGGEAALAIAAHRVRGHGDDPHARRGALLARADAGGRFEAAHLRHLHVHQHDVERLGCGAPRPPRGRCRPRSPRVRAARADRRPRAD